MRKGLFLLYCRIPLVLVILSWGCAPKTLSIFFDGVPNPDDSVSLFNDQEEYLAKQENSYEEPVKEVKTPYFFHLPYQEKECASCHDPNVMGKLVEPLPGLCFQCHDNFNTLYTIQHAPVEAGECLSCHNPHMAESKHLLKTAGQQMCFECHDAGQALNTEYHSEIGDVNCTECHNPHGGQERFMLN